MIRVCPRQERWYPVWGQLREYASSAGLEPPSPPYNLDYFPDWAKREKWWRTVEWAKANGCEALVSLPDEDFIFVEKLGPAQGPDYGPPYRSDAFETRSRPATDELEAHFDQLRANWPDIVGQPIGSWTRPLKFTGAKARRLLVRANRERRPPWGGWFYISDGKGSAFTEFRRAVNEAIAPHEVDHIDFVVVTNEAWDEET
jgi:Dna[CI] antecedent, DciA